MVYERIALPGNKGYLFADKGRKPVDRARKTEPLRWFCQNLKRARKAKGYSQETLCEIAGIDLSHYGAVERGERAITIQKLFQITTALNIPMRYLFSGEPGRPSNENEDSFERLVEFLRGRDAKELELFNEILPRLIEWKSDK
ncbi:MAG: helix-turn-helix transcriptional regulator [Desulfobacterales bacterium]|nr:helix-turn-helix transcriptional regulator [Desulfobacterales bacterium]MBL7102288.1 helix-turn-helix transcriptional regulator [Desulfobacteraceae bacterium]